MIRLKKLFFSMSNLFCTKLFCILLQTINNLFFLYKFERVIKDIK